MELLVGPTSILNILLYLASVEIHENAGWISVVISTNFELCSQSIFFKIYFTRPAPSQRYALNASKSHHLSIGGPPELYLPLSEEAEGKSMQKCVRINDLSKNMNSAFTLSANVLTAVNKASGRCASYKDNLHVLSTPSKLTVHNSRRAVKRWVKGLKDFTYEGTLKALYI